MTDSEFEKQEEKRKKHLEKLLKEGFVTNDSEFDNCLDPELIKKSKLPNNGR